LVSDYLLFRLIRIAVLDIAIMVETIQFGGRMWGYALLALLLICSIFFVGLFCRWVYTLLKPVKGSLSMGSYILLFLATGWPLLFAAFLIWAAHFMGYRHFHTIRIVPERELVACYLWPKGEVHISAPEVASVTVVRKGIGWKASNVLVIKTKSGKKYVSTAPVPEPDVLPDRIQKAIGVMIPK
jgi:hypothetical protein